MGTEYTPRLTIDWDNEPKPTDSTETKVEEKGYTPRLKLDWGTQDTQEETKPVVSNTAREEVRERDLFEKIFFAGDWIRAGGIPLLMGDWTFEDLLRDKGVAEGAEEMYKVWNNPDHKVKTSFMEGINDSLDKIYLDEQKHGANFLSTKAKWKQKYEFELAGYDLVGKEMPKQERDLFESRIKYASDFSFFNWLSRPENSHMRAAYTVGAGLNADLAVEPIGLVLYPIAQGAKALAAVSKFSDKLLTGGKVTKKVSKIKEAREIKKIKKDSEKARALATELEKKVETNVLVYGMDPFTAAQKAWFSTGHKKQTILSNHRKIFGPESLSPIKGNLYSKKYLSERAVFRELAKAPTAAKISQMPEHLIPTKMKKMFDAYKNTTAHRIISNPLDDFRIGSGRLLDHTVGLALTRLGVKSDFIASKTKRFEFDLAHNFNKDLAVAAPWLISYSKMGAKQQRALDKAVFSGNFDEAKSIMKDFDDITKGTDDATYMVNEFDSSVVKLLERKGKQLQAVSKQNIGLSNYFPRHVKDNDGLIVWQDAKVRKLDEQAKEKGIKADTRSEFDADDIIAQLNKELSTDVRIAERKISAEHRRVIKTVDDSNIGFYNSADNSLVNYLREVNHQIALREFLGKSTGYIDDLGNTTISKSIGEYVDEASKLGKIAEGDVPLIKEILRSRFIEGEKGLGKLIRDIKNIGYLTTIANPYSAMIQFGDLGAPAHTQGIINTVTAMARNLKGGKKISYEKEFGQKLMAEMASSKPQGKLNIKNIRSSGDVLDVAMSLSQFKRVDMFGKDVVMNAALNKWKNIGSNKIKVGKEWKYVGKSKALQAEFRSKYRNSFTESEMDKVISDFSNMKIYPNSAQVTGDMKYVLFTELMDVQPITMSQMPVAYLNATAKTGNTYTGWTRLLYQLKTFTLKQMDIVRTRALHKIAHGKVVEGTAELAKYCLILGGTNATMQGAKRKVQDWIEGGNRFERFLEQNPSVPLMLAGNILKLWGIGEREWSLLKDVQFRRTYQELATPVIVSKGDDLVSGAIQANKSFYDTVMVTTPKPIAYWPFFVAYGFANFLSANTYDELENPSKLKRNAPTRETIKRDLPTK